MSQIEIIGTFIAPSFVVGFLVGYMLTMAMVKLERRRTQRLAAADSANRSLITIGEALDQRDALHRRHEHLVGQREHYTKLITETLKRRSVIDEALRRVEAPVDVTVNGNQSSPWVAPALSEDNERTIQ